MGESFGGGSTPPSRTSFFRSRENISHCAWILIPDAFIRNLYTLASLWDKKGKHHNYQCKSSVGQITLLNVQLQEVLSGGTRAHVKKELKKEKNKMRLGASLLPLTSIAFASPWTWRCQPATSFCTRELLVQGASQQVFRPSWVIICQCSQTEAQCRLSCAPATLLWPFPTSATFAGALLIRSVP